jgi:hypothetical protein
MTKRKPALAERVTTGIGLLDALDEWQLVLRSLNRSPATIETYSAAVTQFDGHQRTRHRPITVDEVKPAHVRSYLVAETVRIMGKGRRERLVHGTALALRRYLRARLLHPKASTTDMFRLGKLGAFGGAGIQQMLQRRAAQAGVDRLIRTCSATPSPTAGWLPVAPRAG